MRAWSEMFNAYLRAHGVTKTYTDADYFDHVDGRPRYDGVRAFLASRGITLPEGEPSDSPDTETVCGLGNRKNAAFNAVLERDGVAPYPGSLALLDALAAAGMPMCVVSSSQNAPAVLLAAGIADRFAHVVDGRVATVENLRGKPAPDTYLHAARLVGVEPARAVVIEDATSGVAAGRAGNVGLVVGVDRGVGADALMAAGADVVVEDLAQALP